MGKIKLNRAAIILFICFCCSTGQMEIKDIYLNNKAFPKESTISKIITKFPVMKLENGVLFGFTEKDVICENLNNDSIKRFKNAFIDKYYQCRYNLLDTSLFVANALKGKFKLNDTAINLKMELPNIFQTLLVDSIVVLYSSLYGAGLYDLKNHKSISRFSNKVNKAAYAQTFYDAGRFYVTFKDNYGDLYLEVFNGNLMSIYKVPLKEKGEISDGDVYFYSDYEKLYLSFFEELFILNKLDGKLISHKVFTRNIVGIGRLGQAKCLIVQNKQQIKVVQIKANTFGKVTEFKVSVPDFHKIQTYFLNNKMFFVDEYNLFELDSSLNLKKCNTDNMIYGKDYGLFYDKVLNKSQLIYGGVQ